MAIQTLTRDAPAPSENLRSLRAPAAARAADLHLKSLLRGRRDGKARERQR